jgi:hypothetical protein
MLPERSPRRFVALRSNSLCEESDMKYVLAIAAVAMIGAAVPASADEVGVGVGPVGVTVGTGHGDWDRDHHRTTVIREHEPRDKTVIIKKHHDRDYGPDRKVIIDHDD